MTAHPPPAGQRPSGFRARVGYFLLSKVHRVIMRLAGVRGQLARFAVRLETEIFPLMEDKGKQFAVLQVGEHGGGGALFLEDHPQPLAETGRVAAFLGSIGVRRLELDPHLECNQVSDVLEALWAIRGVLRGGGAGLLARLLGYEQLAGALLGEEGLNVACANVWLLRDRGVVRIVYSYCQTAFSRAVEAFKRQKGVFRDHRRFFHAAPRYALVFGVLSVSPIPAYLLVSSRPWVWIGVNVLAAAVIAAMVFILLESLGSLEYDKEQQGRRLEEEHRMLSLAHGRVQRDIEVARTVQSLLLPPKPFRPFAHKVQTAFWFRPEMAVGGDYYDMKALDGRRLGALLVDVSGHGLSAALMTGLMKMSFELGHPETQGPAEFMGLLNGVLCRWTPADSFATVVYMVYNVEDRSLAYANAGHSPAPGILRASGGLQVLSDPSDLLAGVEMDIEYQEGQERLFPGDCVVMCTDGITDARDVEGEMWGEKRLRETLASLGGRGARGVCDGVREAVQAHARDASQVDDQTIVVFEALE